MIYVFEDKFDDLLSKLYQAGYSEETVQRFIYAKGVGNLPAVVDQALEKYPTELVVVFMDMVPDNRELVPIYKQIRARYRSSSKRVIVIPVICSEYYFIRSIADSVVIESSQGLEHCVEVRPWQDSPLIESDKDRRFCKNFEKYCKLFLLKAVRACAKHTRGDDTWTNSVYGRYYTDNCVCSAADKVCHTSQLPHKSYEYVRRFPCFPSGLAGVTASRLLDREALLALNRNLCELHNEKRLEFKAAGISTPVQMLTPIEP